jgi:tetratricopeptide (TPR) repeat protein
VRATARASGAWRDALILAAILGAGMLLRAVYLRELVREPAFAFPARDGGFHDYWARALAFGEWTPKYGQPDPHIRGVPFLRPPGYPYFLAAVYALTGGSYVGARIVQMALGLLSAALAYGFARALLGRTTGFILAGFCALYWVFPFFEGELQAPVLIVTLSLAMLWALHRWRVRPVWPRAAAAGIALGLLALTQPSSLLFMPVAVAWMIGVARREPGGRTPLRPRVWRSVAVFAAAGLLTIAPATIRNAVVAGDFVPIASNGGVSFYAGNGPGSDGISGDVPNAERWTGVEGWSWFLYDRMVQGIARDAGRPLTHGEVSAYFTRLALAQIARDPVHFLGLCLKRAALFWGPAEVSGSEIVQVAHRQSRALRWNMNFPFVLALALLGVFWLARGSAPRAAPDLRLVGLFVATIFFAYAITGVSERYRAPLIPFIFLFGAHALVRLIERLRARAWRPLGVALAVGVALFALASLPLVPYRAQPGRWHADRGIAYARAGERERAAEEYRAALALEPDLTFIRAKLATLLAGDGGTDEAIEQWGTAVAQRPQDAELQLQLTALLIDGGRARDAIEPLEQLVRARPDLASAQFQLGCALVQTDAWARAAEALDRSLVLDAAQPLARLYRGIVYAQTGDHARAVDEYREALRLDPRLVDGYVNLAQSLLALERRPEALVQVEAALRIDPDNTGARRMQQRLRAPQPAMR